MSLYILHYYSDDIYSISPASGSQNVLFHFFLALVYFVGILLTTHRTSVSLFHLFVSRAKLLPHMKKWFSKALELISTLKDISSLRNSSKAALAISQFFIYEPLISSEHALLY